jgi:hypothetical protein
LFATGVVLFDELDELDEEELEVDEELADEDELEEVVELGAEDELDEPGRLDEDSVLEVLWAPGVARMNMLTPRITRTATAATPTYLLFNGDHHFSSAI